MSTNHLIKLSKSLLLTLALVGSGMALFVPTAQAVKVSVNNFRGTWNAWANYRAGDIVGYQNQSYIAQQANHAQTPTPASPVWYLLAAQGPQGPQGLPGAQGVQGVPGAQGAAGGPGPKGDTGATGPAGPQGPQGAPGINGTNGSFPAGTARGDMQWWDGTAWVMLPAGAHNTTLYNCNGVPTWAVAHCPSFVIGDTGPAGGIVFYLDTTGQHGLEAAPSDLVNAPWGCNGTAIASVNHAVGSGALNTKLILDRCTNIDIAAWFADGYSLNDYDDWYLPSIDDLYFMANNIGQAASAPLTNAGHFADGYYWSSTEYDADSSWNWHFGTNTTDFAQKQLFLIVRPVRSF